MNSRWLHYLTLNNSQEVIPMLLTGIVQIARPVVLCVTCCVLIIVSHVYYCVNNITGLTTIKLYFHFNREDNLNMVLYFNLMMRKSIVTHHIKTGQLSVECISRYYSICMGKNKENKKKLRLIYDHKTALLHPNLHMSGIIFELIKCLFG